MCMLEKNVASENHGMGRGASKCATEMQETKHLNSPLQSQQNEKHVLCVEYMHTYARF
jgi:hypothetical protein